MAFLKAACVQLHCFLLNLSYYRIERQCRGDDSRLIEILSGALRRTPYWKAGHAKIARLYLRRSEVEKAYYAAQTFKALARDSDWEVQYLLGVCYLRNGSLLQAEAVLTAAHRRYPNIFDITEEFAAVLMGLGKYQTAKTVIEKIPEGRRSGELQAALVGCTAAIKKSA